jgi:cytochrome P450
MVVVTDLQEAESILHRRAASFDRASHVCLLFRTIMPKAQIALPTNDMWKHHRRIIGTAMTSKYLSLTTPRANEVVAQLVQLWKVQTERSGGRAFTGKTGLEGATLVSHERVLKRLLTAVGCYL